VTRTLKAKVLAHKGAGNRPVDVLDKIRHLDAEFAFVLIKVMGVGE
jgi:hypothetical protein